MDKTFHLNLFVVVVVVDNKFIFSNKIPKPTKQILYFFSMKLKYFKLRTLYLYFFYHSRILLNHFLCDVVLSIPTRIFNPEFPKLGLVRKKSKSCK